MEPLEALNLLNRVTSTFSGTRQDHVQIQLALGVLETFIKSHGTESNHTSDGKDKEPEDTQTEGEEKKSENPDGPEG